MAVKVYTFLLSERDTLLFIADISGFTKFVNETEITHSSHIISELLEIIIGQNELKLEVAEIEGDAVFYYKSNVIPDHVHTTEHPKHPETMIHLSFRIGNCSQPGQIALMKS